VCLYGSFHFGFHGYINRVLEMVHPDMAIEMMSLSVLSDAMVHIFDKILSNTTAMSPDKLEAVDVYCMRVTSSTPFPLNDPSREPPAEVWLCVDDNSLLDGDPRIISQSIRKAAQAVSESSLRSALGPPRIFDSLSIEQSVMHNFPGELARHAIREADRAITKFRNAQRTGESFGHHSGLVFCPG
jgi:hypothetical protein